MKRDRVTLRCKSCGHSFEVPRSRASALFCSLECMANIENKFIPEPNSGCWLWAGAWDGTKGYGNVVIGGRHMKAHRAVYQKFVGVIPAGLQLDHKCRNPSCVNPAHLEPVTNKENHERAMRVLRARTATHCRHGHEWTPANMYINPSGSRICRKCTSIAQARYLARRPVTIR